MIGLVAIDGVLGQGALSPSIDAAHAVDVEIDIEIDKTTTLNVLGMTGSGFKILLAIIPGTDTEGLETVDAHFPRVGAYLKSTDVATVAIILGMDILGLVVLKRGLVDAEEGGTFAIRIVLPRATTIIADLGEVGRQTHSHAEFGQ